MPVKIYWEHLNNAKINPPHHRHYLFAPFTRENLAPGARSLVHFYTKEQEKREELWLSHLQSAAFGSQCPSSVPVCPISECNSTCQRNRFQRSTFQSNYLQDVQVQLYTTSATTAVWPPQKEHYISSRKVMKFNGPIMPLPLRKYRNRVFILSHLHKHSLEKSW